MSFVEAFKSKVSVLVQWLGASQVYVAAIAGGLLGSVAAYINNVILHGLFAIAALGFILVGVFGLFPALSAARMSEAAKNVALIIGHQILAGVLSLAFFSSGGVLIANDFIRYLIAYVFLFLSFYYLCRSIVALREMSAKPSGLDQAERVASDESSSGG